MATYGVISKQTNFAPVPRPQTGKALGPPPPDPNAGVAGAVAQGPVIVGRPAVAPGPKAGSGNPDVPPGDPNYKPPPVVTWPADPGQGTPYKPPVTPPIPTGAPAWFVQNVDSRIPEAQWAKWIEMGLLDPKATGNARFKSENVDENGQPIQGLFEKPTDCPEGKAKFSTNQCLPLSDPRLNGAGGAGGSDQGGGGPGGAGNGMSDQEKAYLSAITDLARQMSSQGKQMFDVGLPAYQQATDYFQKLLGLKGRAGVQEAIAPAAEQVAGAYRGARSQIVMSGARGAAKDIALADAARAEAGDVSSIASSQQAGAAQGLLASSQFGVTAGFQGEGMGAQTEMAVSGALTQNRQFEEGLTQNWNIAALNARTTKEVAALQATVSREAIAAQKEIAQAQLAQHADEFAKQMDLMIAQFNEQMRQFNLQYKQSGSNANKQLIGTGAAVVAGLIIA